MKNWLTNVGSSLSKTAGKTGLMIKKNSPEILLGAGIIGFVGTVVLACRSTLKAEEVLEKHKQAMQDIHDAKEVADAEPEKYEYDLTVYRRDVGVQYLKTTGNFVKLYGPAAALGAVSLACILASRNIMQKRYVALLGAYNGLSMAFDQYRERVRTEYGEGLDRHFRYGTEYSTITETEVDEDGKKIKKKVSTENTALAKIPDDDTCRVFDSNNPNWDDNPSFSMTFLRGQQNYLCDRYHTTGHIFLNEVYDALGFPHTPQGAIIGWVDDGHSDDPDFGLYNIGDDGVRRFINGVDNIVLLEFNHHNRIIYDKI